MSEHLFQLHEVCIHYSRPLLPSLPQITRSNEAEELLRNIIDAKRIDHKEFFWVMLVSRANHVIGISEIGRGGTAGVVVNNKEIFQLAVQK